MIGWAGADTGPAFSVALVNNMPDSAFVETEDQFRRALTAQHGADAVQLELYTINEIPRSPTLAPVIESRYRGLEELWTSPPDALIVTGTEPTRPHLSDEPCWPYLARLLQWAATSVPTTFLSCLTAHVSLLLFDGIERRPRARKCSGVYLGEIETSGEPLTLGLPSYVPVPHSRINEVPESLLSDAGYEILIGSGSSAAGWMVAARRQADGLFVLCQGHPEYSTLSLLREYRRDVRRWLSGDRATAYPELPEGYLEPEATARLDQFARRAAARDADPARLWPQFPYADVAVSVQNRWAPASGKLFGNWLSLARAATPAPA